MVFLSSPLGAITHAHRIFKDSFSSVGTESRSTHPTGEWHKLVPRYFAGFYYYFFFVFILLLFFFMFVVSPLAAVSRSAASTAAAAAAALHRNVIEIFAYAWQQRRHLNALFAGVFKPRFLSWSCTLKLEKICSHSTSPVLFDAIFWYFFQRQFRTWKIAKVARKIINAVIFRRHFPCCCYIFRIDENQLRCWRIFFTSGSCLLVFKTNIFAVKMF